MIPRKACLKLAAPCCCVTIQGAFFYTRQQIDFHALCRDRLEQDLKQLQRLLLHT